MNGLEAIKSRKSELLGIIRRKACVIAREMEDLKARIDRSLELGTDCIIGTPGEIWGETPILDEMSGQYRALSMMARYLKEEPDDAIEGGGIREGEHDRSG